MKRLLWAAVVVGSAASPTLAQEPTPAAAPRVAVEQTDPHASMANLTPEMWLYMQQLERYDDPKMAVRRKAEERAAQRTNRIAARKWFGLSNSRPTASPIPVMGTYSPFWSGNDSDPNRWNGVGPAVVITRDDDTLR